VVYDLDTGEPCGRSGPHGTILPLSQPTLDEEIGDAAAEAAPAQPGRAEGVQYKKDQEFEIFDLP
jgi:hypothetical protein